MGGKAKQDKECALQISGLSATASEATLMNVFRPFGSIVRIALNGMNGAYVGRFAAAVSMLQVC